LLVNSPFVPGLNEKPELPLARFLPPLPAGMSHQWISSNIPRGSWILDPFGNSPELALELARSGYQVLVTANNPVNSFLIEVLSLAPTKLELEEALGLLANSIFNDQTLESYIRSFYKVPCNVCGHPIEVSSFIWRKDEASPFGFFGTCHNCGKSSEQILTPEARAGLPAIPSFSLHHARALESIVSLDNPQRAQVETALSCYLPRPVVLLQILLFIISKLAISTRQISLLQALLLSTLDRSSSLWAYPTPTTQRRQLTIPNVFLEHNIWEALNQSLTLWSEKGTPISCKTWPEPLPLSGGISLFKGRLREIEPSPSLDMIQACIAIPPRPNQAFWTLSAVWAGWLWGKNAVQPIKQALSRQRYDWNWHTNALRSSFQAVKQHLGESTHFYLLILENEHSFLSAAFYAAKSAGFDLGSASISGDDQVSQSVWSPGNLPLEQPESDNFFSIGHNAATQYLNDCFEPSNYDRLYASILQGLCFHDYIGSSEGGKLELPLTEMVRQTDTIFLDKETFTRFGGGSASLDTGLYWLSKPAGNQISLSDRVEQKIEDLLHEPEPLTLSRMQQVIYDAFPGLLTPSDDLLYACLDSYSERVSGEEDHWRLRSNERYEKRLEDLEEIRAKCISIGKTLHYQIEEDRETIHWRSDSPESSYSLYLTISAKLSRLSSLIDQRGHKIIIIPGSRANLLAYKLKHNPFLSKVIAEHFKVVKFRQIRSIFENPLLTRELWDILIQEDPPELNASQLALL
jgi:hypothetical protein